MPPASPDSAGGRPTGIVKDDQALARYVPVCFSRMSDDVLSGFSLHMRSLNARGEVSFTLYAGSGLAFTPAHRQRLFELGAVFLYIPASEQHKLRRKLEERVESVAADTQLDLASRCEIVYETAVELI